MGELRPEALKAAAKRLEQEPPGPARKALLKLPEVRAITKAREILGTRRQPGWPPKVVAALALLPSYPRGPLALLRRLDLAREALGIHRRAGWPQKILREVNRLEQVYAAGERWPRLVERLPPAECHTLAKVALIWWAYNEPGASLAVGVALAKRSPDPSRGKP